MTWYAGKSAGFRQPPLGQLSAFGTSVGVSKGNRARKHKGLRQMTVAELGKLYRKLIVYRGKYTTDPERLALADRVKRLRTYRDDKAIAERRQARLEFQQRDPEGYAKMRKIREQLHKKAVEEARRDEAAMLREGGFGRKKKHDDGDW